MPSARLAVGRTVSFSLLIALFGCDDHSPSGGGDTSADDTDTTIDLPFEDVVSDAGDDSDDTGPTDAVLDSVDDGAGDLEPDAPAEDSSVDLPVEDTADVASEDAVDVSEDAVADPDVTEDTAGSDVGDLADSADVPVVSLPDEPIYPEDCQPRIGAIIDPAGLSFVRMLTGDTLMNDCDADPPICNPVQIAFPRDRTNRAFIVMQSGQILVADPFSQGGDTEIWLDLSDDVEYGGEMGLLSMAFHPDFANNGEVYVNYTAFDPNLQTIIRRFTVADPMTGSPPEDPEDIILTIDQPFTNHNGGQIAFGPEDGYLYIGMGDGGSGGDPAERAQNPAELLGKMLRIDVDNTDEGLDYAIPDDNPFVDTVGYRDEIWALGLRNPWRFTFDEPTGNLWLGDVGQNAREEVDLIEGGENYGWDVMEGSICHEPASGCNMAGLTLPVWDYPRSLGSTVTGGYVYRGSLYPDLVGVYLVADFGSGRFWGLSPDGGGDYNVTQLIDTSRNISAFGLDPDGEVYAVDWTQGQILRLVYEPESVTPARFVDQLSDTGCFEDLATRTFAEGVLAYTVNAPLWSDGAAKDRGIALPEGGQIDFQETAAWGFPEGTALIKTFVLGDTPLETRFLVREDGEWVGATYRWNEAGTDADLLEESETLKIGDQTWYFPSPDDCQSCHTGVAGGVLGLRTPQMNRDGDLFRLEIIGNQIEHLAEVGYFDDIDTLDAGALPRFPEPSDAEAPLAERARAYIDANCSHCHRPGGGTPSTMDLRWDTALPDTHTCDETPLYGSFGITNACLIGPGEPDRSIIAYRLASEEEGVRMPPLAHSVADAEGLALVRDFIQSLSGCE